MTASASANTTASATLPAGSPSSGLAQCRSAVTTNGSRAIPASPAVADRVDELPLAHPRPSPDALLLGDLVELLAIALLQRVACLAAAAAAPSGLFLKPLAGALGKMGDRTFSGRRLLRLLDVL